MPDKNTILDQGSDPDPDDTTGSLDYDQAVGEDENQGLSAITGEEDTFTDVDPETLTPELREAWQNMQAGFTRSMQRAAELRRDAEAANVSDPKISQKAELLDKIIATPGGLEAITASLTGTARGQAHQSAEVQSAYPSVKFDDWKPEDVEVMEAASERYARKHVLPIAQQMAARIGQLEQQIASMTWSETARAFPGAQDKALQVSEFITRNRDQMQGLSQEDQFRKAIEFLGVQAPTKTSTPGQGGRTRKSVNGNLTGASVSTVGAKPKSQGKSLAELLAARMSAGGIELPRG
jgi:hypothetical protein